MKHISIFGSLLVMLTACTAPVTQAPLNREGAVPFYAEPLRGSDPDACWGKDVIPAVIETVRERVLVAPEVLDEDGSLKSDPVYRDELRQKIVRERQEIWFQTPCQDQLTPDIIATLQRALKARGLYTGALSGAMDGQTRGAIRKFQAPEGLDSSVLSLWAARKLGLVAIEA